MENNNDILTIKNLCKSYDEDKDYVVKALNNINLTVKKGEILGLVGESGCGKSTLGQVLVKLKNADSGDVIYNFDGKEYNLKDLKGKELRDFRKNVQIIFQDPYSSLNPKKKVGYLLREPLIIHKLCKKSEMDGIVEKMLTLVGLDSSYKDKYPNELSGGQRQRVAIAAALILRPKFVVCDEAVSSLDVSVQAQILNLLKDLQRKFDLTYIFISHNLNVVSYIADRVAVMYFGDIVELGDAEEVTGNPKHPYTKLLFSSGPAIRRKTEN